MHARLARAYAIGEWKRIDWATLHDRTAPKIADAARAKDRAAFYLALREYLWSLHDGHVGLAGDDAGLRNAAIKGGFGLALLRLDDGRTIAHVVTAGGPAARAGLTWGADDPLLGRRPDRGRRGANLRDLERQIRPRRKKASRSRG